MKAAAFAATLALPVALAACTARDYGDGLAADPTPASFQRALAAPPGQVASAAAAVLRRIGLPVEFVDGGRALVLSGTVTVQDEWGGRPIETRLLCGVPFLHMGDREVGEWVPLYDGDDELERAIEYTRGLPIEVRMGFEADPRLGGSTVTLLMAATGQIASPSPLGPREVFCFPTRRFVDELFAGIAAQLPGGAPGVDGVR